MSKSTYKYQRLKTELAEAIRTGVLPPGSRVEPELALMARFGLSRNTVRQALRELEVEHLVCRSRGSGTFVRPPLPRRIAFFMPDAAYATYPLNSDIIRGIDSILAPAGLTLEVTVGAFRYDAETISRLAADCAAVLIATNALDLAIPASLLKRKIPFRLVKNYHPGYEAPAIRFNYEKAGRLLVEYLEKRGARKIALFGLNPEIHCTAAEFQQGVMLACLEFGMALPAAARVNAFGKSPGELRTALRNLPFAPDAIICGADEIAFPLTAAAGIPVVGCNDLPEAAFRGLTTVRLDGFRLGAVAARAILGDLNGVSENVPPLDVELIIRGD